MALAIMILIYIFLAIFCYKLYQALRFKLPPGPRPLPVVGNIYQVKPIKFRCFADWSKIYGPIFSLYYGSQLNVVVSSAALAKEVLRENDQFLADRYRTRSSDNMSRGGKDLIWADYGPHYVKVRKLCNLELFSPKRVETFRPIREDEYRAMVEAIYKDCMKPEMEGKSLKVRQYISPVSFNNSTRLAFGKRFKDSEGVVTDQGKEFKKISFDGLTLTGTLSIAEYIPSIRWLYKGETKALAKFAAARDRLTRLIMDEHTLNGNTKQHFIDVLINLQNQYDISEDTLIGLLWDMIVAGVDTVTISAEWAMAELIKNPHVQQKAQEELDRIIGPNGTMTEAHICKLPYMQCVIKEVLRLHPPTPLMVPHKASARVKIGGYDIPKGSVVHVNVWAIGRDPEIWDNPEEFKPERFLEKDIDMKGSDFRFLPFGAGRRICPATQLAINMTTSMIAHLLHHFSFGATLGVKLEDIDMSERPGIISYMASPIHAVITPRLPHKQLYQRVTVEM